MTSQVLNNPNALNEGYPVKGVNNDSQGFRDNFSTIKTALSTAKTEITDLHNKTITVSGDATGVSGILGAGSGTANLSLTLVSQSKLTPGTYDTSSDTLNFKVNAKGLITEITATPITTIVYTGVKGTWTPLIDSYVAGPPSSGTGAITLPSFTVNDQGQITNVATVTLPNFGIRGHQLTKGYLVAGDQNNKSDVLAVGLDGQVLTADSTTPLGVKWATVTSGGGGGSYTPPTYTGVTGTWTPTISSYPGNGSISIPTFTINNYGHITGVGTTTLPEFGLSGHTLTKGSLIVGDSTNKSNTFTVGSDGQFLVADSTAANGVKWFTPTSQAPADGSGIEILGSNTVNLALQKLTASTSIGNNDLILFRDQATATHKTIKLTDLASAVSSNIQIVKDTTPKLGGDLDVQNYLIKTTHASATVAINATNLKLNGQKWPQTQGSANTFLTSDGAGNLTWSVFGITAGTGLQATPTTITGSGSISLDIPSLADKTTQYLTNDQIAIARGGVHYKVSLNDFLVNYGTNVIFVDYYRNRSYEANGSFVHPYADLAAALIAAVDGSTIIVMPGTYSNPITLTKKNIKIIGFGPRGSVKITEPLTISSRLISTYIEGLSFDFSSKTDSAYTTPAIAMTGNTDGLVVKNCDLLRGPYSYSLLPIVTLSGTQNDHVWISGCTIQGKITNSFTANNYNVYVNDFNGDTTNSPTIETNGNSRTFVTNGTVVRLIKHLGGYLEVSNVGNLLGHPGYADNYVAVESSAGGASDALVLRNTSLIYSGDVYYLKKTGSCAYGLTNVVLDDTSVYAGTRMLAVADDGIGFTSVYKDVISSPASYALDVNKFKTFNLTMQNSVTLNLINPINFDETSSYQGSLTITVAVQQDATGTRTCTFTAPSTILWDQSAAQPAAQTGANKITVYQFIKIGNSGPWLGKCIFKQN